MEHSDRSEQSDLGRDAELRRNADEVVARLAGRGVRAEASDDPESLVRLLDAIERFEAEVQRRGGDLMLDEPVGSKPVRQPDNPAFVLPKQADDDTIDAYRDRVEQAISRL